MCHSTLKPRRMIFLRKAHKTRVQWTSDRGFRAISGERIRKGRRSLLRRLLQSYGRCQRTNDRLFSHLMNLDSGFCSNASLRATDPQQVSLRWRRPRWRVQTSVGPPVPYEWGCCKTVLCEILFREERRRLCRRPPGRRS